MSTTEELLTRFYPEANLNGFCHSDGTVTFFNQISAALKPTDVVLDFGAGRGEAILDDRVKHRQQLSNLQGRCARLEGCDISPAVLSNPFVDHAEVTTLGEPLPYADNEFDIIIVRSVLEHIDDPVQVSAELLRVVKPGGLIAAVTPNKYGYIAMASRLVPNRMHVGMLRSVQPERKAEDVFPTRYRMNTPSALRRQFGDRADVYVTSWSSEPGYHFGNRHVFRLIRWANKHLPSALQPELFVYIVKR